MSETKYGKFEVGDTVSYKGIGGSERSFIINSFRYDSMMKTFVYQEFRSSLGGQETTYHKEKDLKLINKGPQNIKYSVGDKVRVCYLREKADYVHIGNHVKIIEVNHKSITPYRVETPYIEGGFMMQEDMYPCELEPISNNYQKEIDKQNKQHMDTLKEMERQYQEAQEKADKSGCNIISSSTNKCNVSVNGVELSGSIEIHLGSNSKHYQVVPRRRKRTYDYVRPEYNRKYKSSY